MTTELEKQRAEKAASDKAYYLKMVDYHKKESEHYLAKADACDEIGLVSAAAPGSFGGL